MVATLLCFALSGPLAASGEEQKADKETYQQQMEKTLKGFQQKMEEMKSTAVELKVESKEKFEREMAVLKEKKEAADKRLEELKSSTAADWQATKAEMDKAADDLKRHYDEMKSRFRKE